MQGWKTEESLNYKRLVCQWLCCWGCSSSRSIWKSGILTNIVPRWLEVEIIWVITPMAHRLAIKIPGTSKRETKDISCLRKGLRSSQCGSVWAHTTFCICCRWKQGAREDSNDGRSEYFSAFCVSCSTAYSETYGFLEKLSCSAVPHAGNTKAGRADGHRCHRVTCISWSWSGTAW